MKEIESYCPDHNLQFSKYCTSCEQPYCANCPAHDEEHMVLPLPSVITPKAFSQQLKDVQKIFDNVEAALHIIPQVVDDLLNSMRSGRDNPLDEDKKDFTTLKKFENKINNQVKDLALVTGAYDTLKLRVEKLIKRGENLKPIIDADYHNNLFEAYRAVIELKGYPQEIEEAKKEMESLEKKMEEISSIYVKEEIEQRQTFKKFNEYIENLRKTIELVGKETLIKIDEYHTKISRIRKEMTRYKEASENPIKINEGKRLRTNRRIREIEGEMEALVKEREELLAFLGEPEEEDKELKAKTKELDEARESLAVLEMIYEKSHSEINTIPTKLLQAKEELDEIMRRRRSELDEVSKCINQVRNNRAWMQKTIAAKKEKITSEIKYQEYYKKHDVLRQINMTEKKLLLRNVKERLEQLTRDKEYLMKSLKNRKEEITKMKNYYIDIKRDKVPFQVSIDRLELEKMVMTLNDIEKSKKDIEESSKVNRSDLVSIINDLIIIKNEIELSIEQKETDLRESAEMPKELEDEVYSLMDKCESNLKPLKEFLEENIASEESVPYPLCADGRPGKVELKCGHHLCYQCFFKQREDNMSIECLSCGGIRQEIGNSLI